MERPLFFAGPTRGHRPDRNVDVCAGQVPAASAHFL
jgi:hypothetical protein